MDNIWHNLFNFLKEKGLAFLLLSIIFTFSSLLWTSDIVYNQEDLKSIDLGWPIHFVSQEYEQLTPPDSWFPHNLGVGIPQEHSTSFSFLPFLLAIFLNFIVIFFIVFVLICVHPKLRFIERIIRVKYIMIGVIGVFVFISVSAVIFNNYYQYKFRISEEGLIRRFNNGNIPTPAPTIFSWQDALEILYSGEVKKVSQSHNLDVQFVLRNGNIINTKEPYIDEIFKELKKCGRICGNIIPATE